MRKQHFMIFPSVVAAVHQMLLVTHDITEGATGTGTVRSYIGLITKEQKPKTFSGNFVRRDVRDG